MRSNRFAFAPCCSGRSTRAHTIGVKRERDEARHQDRDRDRAGEFAEDAPDDAAHEEHRNEHRHERHGDRQNGEADLARALERGRERLLAFLDMAHDVLEHHDGVVDDEADAQASGRGARCCRSSSRAHTSRRKCRRARSASASAGISVADTRFRNRKITMMTSTMAMPSDLLDVVRPRRGSGPSGRAGRSASPRQEAAPDRRRDASLTGSTTSMVLASD